MKQLLQLMGQAWAENTRTRTWDFEMKGLTGAITVHLYPNGRACGVRPEGGTYFNDTKGIAAACKFIQDNLIGK